MNGTTLILGATGSFGGAVAMELLNRGRPVRLLARDVTRARARFGNRANGEIVEGDAEDADAVAKAAAGCAAVVHGVNYPFHRWSPAMETVTNNVIAAAEQAGAVILFPGNVYALGPADGPVPDDAPNRPTTKKGAIRAKLEQSLREAAQRGRCRAVVLRAGDYFGPGVRNPLVDMVFGAAAGTGAIRFVGDLARPHQWAYIPDLARAAVALLDATDRLAPYEAVNFAGHVAPSQREFLQRIAAAAGRPEAPIRPLPWWQVRLAGLVNPGARELMELRYLYNDALILEERRLRDLAPDLGPTPLDTAVRATLASYRRWIGATPARRVDVARAPAAG